MLIIKKQYEQESRNGILKKALVLYRSQYYVASDNGSETLIFKSDDKGTIKNFNEVGGACSTSLNEVLSQFSDYMY